jgi:hypothetical protein
MYHRFEWTRQAFARESTKGAADVEALACLLARRRG